jgi:hypothetical protein
MLVYVESSRSRRACRLEIWLVKDPTYFESSDLFGCNSSFGANSGKFCRPLSVRSSPNLRRSNERKPKEIIKYLFWGEAYFMTPVEG